MDFDLCKYWMDRPAAHELGVVLRGGDEVIVTDSTNAFRNSFDFSKALNSLTSRNVLLHCIRPPMNPMTKSYPWLVMMVHSISNMTRDAMRRHGIKRRLERERKHHSSKDGEVE